MSGDASSPPVARVAGFPVATERPHLWRGKAWFWLPILPLVIADLWTKSAVFAFVPGAVGRSGMEPVFAWGDFVRFSLVKVCNKGTIWGLGQGLHLPLVVLRCVAIVLIVWFAAATMRRARLQLLVLGVILAGAIGNLWDNLTVDYPGYEGGVRYFLLFEFGASRWPFPAFNVADSCICVGAITLAAILWSSERHEKPS